MELDFAHPHNPNLFGSLANSPPTSMFDPFSPLLQLNAEFLDELNATSTATATATTTSTPDEDTDDWLKPLLLDQLFEHDLLSQPLNNENVEDEKRKFLFDQSNPSILLNEKFLPTTANTMIQPIRENETFDFFSIRSTEQQIPSTTTTTTTVRVIHQPKIETTDLPTTLFFSGNDFQFHPIVTTNHSAVSTSKTIGHTYTATRSSPIPSVPIVPARVLKGKKFKRGARMSSRAASRSHGGAAAKRRLNSTAAEPKASVVIIAEDATRIDSKTTTLGLSSTGPCSNESDLLKNSSIVNSTRSSTRRRVKSAPREVILFRNGTFVSKEPISKQQTNGTVSFETPNNANPSPLPSTTLHQQQITGTGLQAAAQIVACNVLRQATFNDALIEQLIKREPAHTDEEYPIYCYSTPSLVPSSCTVTNAFDEYENSCSTTLKILGCNTTAPLHSTAVTNPTTTIEFLTFAALQQQQAQVQPQFCYIKQEPASTTTTTTTTFLLPRLIPQ